MLEPFSALAVATAAVQFLDFSLKALELCRQIRDDAQGATAANKALETSTKELNGLMKELQTQATNNTSQTGRRISKIVADCRTLADDLVKLLELVRGAARKKPFGAANATLKALKGTKKIEKLKNALKEKQTMLDTAVTYDIHARMGQLAADQVQPFTAMMSKYDDLMDTLRKQQQQDSQSFHEITQRLVTVASQNDRVEQAVHECRDTVVQDLGGRFDALQMQKVKDVWIRSLDYPENQTRRAMIKTPSLRTFDWIFEDENQALKQSTKNKRWSNFSNWLREGPSLYWISGKAASGKSTLMVHIVEEPATKDSLNIWASGKPLHVLCFFFWRPGSALQKTVQGLLRSLLFQMLPEVPGLTESLASEYLVHPDICPVWSQKQLTEMFERALQIADKAQHCFGIFIDGLDEFEGDVDELLQLIFRLEGYPYVKCCVSSRPETHLKHHLSRCATLRLQELNHDDIVAFVEEKLGVYDVPSKFIKEMAEDIGRRADGVFLWAALTIQSIIRGITSHDDLDILLQRLDTYPPDMDGLFEKMLEDVDEVHKESLCFYLRALMMFSRDPEIGGSPSIVLLTASRGHSPMDYQQFIKMCEQTGKQILAQSRGLLEVHSGDTSLLQAPEHDLSQYSTLSDMLRQLDTSIVPQYTSDRSQNISLETPSGRQKSFSARHLVTSNEVTRQLLVLESSTVQWVHRCAYDFMLLHRTDRISKLLHKISDTEVAQRLADASIKLFVALPWPGFSFDEHTITDGIVECMRQSLDRCWNLLYISMHQEKDSASASLIELEALIDRLGGEALPISTTHSRPPSKYLSIDYWRGEIRGQYEKELLKSFLWTVGSYEGFFDIVSAEMPRLANHKFGAILVSSLLEATTHSEASIGTRMAFQGDVLRTLHQIYLGGLVDSKGEKHDNIAFTQTLINFTTVWITWRPTQWPVNGWDGVLEEGVMSRINVAFIRWITTFRTMSKSSPQTSMRYIPGLVGPLLPMLQLWDTYFGFIDTDSAEPPIELQISHRNLLLPMAKQNSSPDSQIELQDFKDAFEGRIRVCSQHQRRSFTAIQALSPYITEQLVDLLYLRLDDEETQPPFLVQRDLVVAILSESAEQDDNYRDLVLACLYSLLDWQYHYNYIPPQSTSKRSQSLNDLSSWKKPRREFRGRWKESP